jgi:hypothetical protein
MLRALASVVLLGSESFGTRNHILLSQIWDFPFRRLLRPAGSRWRYSTPPPHGYISDLSESESYVTTDCQSDSLSWNKAPSWGLRPVFNYFLTVAGLLIWAFSLTRGRVCPLHLLLDLPSAVNLGSEFLGTHDHIRVTVSDSRLPFSAPPTTLLRETLADSIVNIFLVGWASVRENLRCAGNVRVRFFQNNFLPMSL